MSATVELIQARMAKSDEAFELAVMAMSRGFWNSAASELYYSCFHMVNALFAKHHINASTHSGLKTLFNLHFIKEGKLDAQHGKLLNNLFSLRQEADYGDFLIMTKEEIEPLYTEVGIFRKTILDHIQQPE